MLIEEIIDPKKERNTPDNIGVPQKREDPHKVHGLDIAKDDPRYWLYRNTIKGYSGDTYSYINAFLGKFYKNNKFTMDDTTIEDIRMLDDIMENHPIKHDITIYHGAKENPFRLWRNYRSPLDKPVLTHWPAFISTSTSIRTAMWFASMDVIHVLPNIVDYISGDSDKKRWFRKVSGGPFGKLGYNFFVKNVLQIRVPAGTPGLSIKAHSQVKHEDEILLGRGLEIQINPFPTFKGEYLFWDCEVKYINPTPEFFQETKI